MFSSHFKSNFLCSIMHPKMRFSFTTAIFGLFFFALSSCDWFNNVTGNAPSSAEPPTVSAAQAPVTPHDDNIKTLTFLLPGINDDPKRDEFQQLIQEIQKKCNNHGLVVLIQPLKQDQYALSLEKRTKNTIQAVKDKVEVFSRNNSNLKEIRIILGGYSLGGVTALDAAMQIQKEIASIQKGKKTKITIAAGFTINSPMGGIQKPQTSLPLCDRLYQSIASGVGGVQEHKKLEANSAYFKQLHANIRSCGFPILTVASFVDTSLVNTNTWLGQLCEGVTDPIPKEIKDYIINSDGILQYNSQVAIDDIKGLNKGTIAIVTYKNCAHGELQITKDAQNQAMLSLLEFCPVESILRQQNMHHVLTQFILNPGEAVKQIGIHIDRSAISVA